MVSLLDIEITILSQKGVHLGAISPICARLRPTIPCAAIMSVITLMLGIF